eukprot:SAG31_NODE_24740_length_475_cov_0.688830_1_plen_25_part_10
MYGPYATDSSGISYRTSLGLLNLIK